MAFEITELRRPAAGAMWTSPARLCVTADGELCDELDPRAVRLLVSKGGQLPVAEAARYGLVGDEFPEAPKERKAPANKARKGITDKAGETAQPEESPTDEATPAQPEE